MYIGVQCVYKCMCVRACVFSVTGWALDQLSMAHFTFYVYYLMESASLPRKFRMAADKPAIVHTLLIELNSFFISKDIQPDSTLFFKSLLWISYYLYTSEQGRITHENIEGMVCN